MTPPHIFPAESIMGIIPSRPTHAIAGRLIRNSSAHTLIAARHEDGATQGGEPGATRAMEQRVRHNVVLDEGWLRDQETRLRATIS